MPVIRASMRRQSRLVIAGLVGAPYSGASISASGAAGGPEAVRMAFRYNTTYSPDWDTDIQSLAVRDLRDISGSLTDVAAAHQHIEDAMTGLLALRPFIPIMVGGDHSVTAPAIRGFARAKDDLRKPLAQGSMLINDGKPEINHRGRLEGLKDLADQPAAVRYGTEVIRLN